MGYILYGMALIEKDAFLPDYTSATEYGWGDKKFKYSYIDPDKVVGGNLGATYSSFSNIQQTYYWGLTELDNYSDSKKFGGVSEEFVQLEPRLEKYPPITILSLKEDTWQRNVVSADVGTTIQPYIPDGYEFYGWKYIQYYAIENKYPGIYAISSDDQNISPVILKPDFNFNGAVEVVDAKIGKIKILDELYESSYQSINEAKTLYYNFLVPVVRYIERTVSFDTKDGSSIDPILVGGGGSITLPASNKVGYVLSGWYYKDSLGTDVFAGKVGDSFTPPSDVTLYAVWEVAPITVSYNANGGQFLSGSNSRDILFDSPYGAFPTVENKGYLFEGWWTDKEGGDRVYEDSLVAIPESHTLYARWKASRIKVTKRAEDEEDVDVADIGTLSLYSSEDDYKTAIASDIDGVLDFSGSSEPNYRIKYDLKSDGEDRFWESLGVKINNSYQLEPELDMADGGEVELEYYIKRKALFSVKFEYINEEGGTVKVTNPIEADKDGKYFGQNPITITANPNNGYYLSSAILISNEMIIASFENIKNNTFVIDSLDRDITVRCIFTRKSYSLSSTIDSKSTIAIDSVSISQDGEIITTASYGDKVVFSANVKEGYNFAGWFNGDELASENVEFECVVQDDVNLVAKASVQAKFNVSYNSDNASYQKSCFVLINGSAVNLPYTQDVILGNTLSFELKLGALEPSSVEMWKFEAWYDNNSGKYLTYPLSASFEPTENIDWAAKVVDKIKEHTLSIEFVDEEGVSTLLAKENAVKVSPEPKSLVVNGNIITLVYEGTKELQFEFTEVITANNEELGFLKVDFNGETYAEDNIFKFLVNSDASLIAYYATGGVRTTSVDFTDNSDRSMGEIVINGISSNTQSTPIQLELARGSKILLSARARNGYKFVGWYKFISGLGDASYVGGELELTVTTNRTLYAKFAKDSNAVFEWEGSNANKMITWRSKTYAATNPFNPSACRVDTTGYPVALLSVEMFSSPDSKPTAVASLKNIKSQDSRRLPVRRMERYLQVAIQNDEEVDVVLIGTSMGGLSV